MGGSPASGAVLAVRPLRADEAPQVVDYFLGLGDDDLARMGIVERSRFPARDQWIRAIQAAQSDPEAARSFYTAWLVDGVPVGFSSLKNLRVGQDADMHLHLWSAAHRGRGHGGVLFSLAALDGYGRFRLQRIVCEPKSTNPMPNRMLAKAGYPLLGTRVGASSELSQVTTLNRYGITREAAAAALRRAGVVPPQSP